MGYIMPTSKGVKHQGQVYFVCLNACVLMCIFTTIALLPWATGDYIITRVIKHYKITVWAAGARP